jgi:precorrin-6B methylase 2
MDRVGVVRAVGVVFSESGTPEQKARAVDWLQSLLGDPEEKIRRYAMNALPKLGGVHGQGEGKLLNILQSPASEREQRALSRTLEKVGGRATLAAAKDPFLRQKVQANVAREEAPGSVDLDRVLQPLKGLRVNFHCREGLEDFVIEEISPGFRLLDRRRGLIRTEPVSTFSLGEIFQWRTFAGVGFEIEGGALKSPADFAKALVSCLPIFQAFTQGAIRYRMEMHGSGNSRPLLREIAELTHAKCPCLLNDSRAALWQVDLRPMPQGGTLEIRPRLRPDPRFVYRQGDVPAASHPPLAACMARLAGSVAEETVWDPFCGSGLELIERGLCGGVRKMFGTDNHSEALEITRRNYEAAGLGRIPLALAACDFREALTLKSFEPVSLILTNPPMGRRVPIADLQGLIEDLFLVARKALKPGGRLVFVNPLPIRPKALRLNFRRKIDLGGFSAHLEKYSL